MHGPGSSVLRVYYNERDHDGARSNMHQPHGRLQVHSFTRPRISSWQREAYAYFRMP